MRILALDAALARCSVALVEDGVVLARRAAPSGRGQSAMLAPMVAQVLDEAAQKGSAGGFDAVATTIGPGSFTGLRTAIALAHGLATFGCPVVGVTVAEAFAEQVGAEQVGAGQVGAGQVGDLRGRVLWVAIDSRRGRVFLDIGGVLRPCALADLPVPDRPLAIAGDAAIAVASLLAGRGFDVRLTDARLPDAACVAAVAARRVAGLLPPLAAQPMYVDPPEAKLPAGGLRPPPLSQPASGAGA